MRTRIISLAAAAAVSLMGIGMASMSPGHYTGPGRRDHSRRRDPGTGEGATRAREALEQKRLADAELYANARLPSISRQTIRRRVRKQMKRRGEMPTRPIGQRPPESVFVLDGEKAVRLRGRGRRIYLGGAERADYGVHSTGLDAERARMADGCAAVSYAAVLGLEAQ